MGSELDRNLRRSFAPAEGAERRVARAALESRTRAAARWPWLVASLVALVLVLALVVDRRSPTDEPAAATYVITNERDVIAVVSASGEALLLAAVDRVPEPGGGLIVSLGESR